MGAILDWLKVGAFFWEVVQLFFFLPLVLIHFRLIFPFRRDQMAGIWVYPLYIPYQAALFYRS